MAQLAMSRQAWYAADVMLRPDQSTGSQGGRTITMVPEDPHLWLEEIASPAVLNWVAERNIETIGALGDARFEQDRRSALALLDADDNIPNIGRRGRYVYN